MGKSYFFNFAKIWKCWSESEIDGTGILIENIKAPLPNSRHSFTSEKIPPIQRTVFFLHFVKNLWQIRRDTCNFYITFIFRSVPMWRLPKNRQNLTFQISILLHTRDASFQCLSWLSEPCAVPVFSSSTLPHVAHCAKAREELLVAPRSTVHGVIGAHSGHAGRSPKAAVPFRSALWVHHRHGQHWTSHGRMWKGSCMANPGAPLRKASCPFCNLLPLKYNGEQCDLLSNCLLQCPQTHF